jgi:hypothetical protein
MKGRRDDWEIGRDVKPYNSIKTQCHPVVIKEDRNKNLQRGMKNNPL